MGAAAVAGAAGGVATKANAQQVSQWVKYATDLATKSMGRIHQDTGYDLRNWLVVNVSNWVTDYCTKTNSYNAKEVIDYCNQQGLEASGLDKQNALVTAFLTNMKNRYQDFLSAYRAGINESFQKFNAAVQSKQQEKNAMGNLGKEEFDVLIDALIVYAICKDRQLDNSDLFKAVAASIKRFIDANNAKDYVNSIYPKAKQSVEVLKNNPELYQKESAQFFRNAGSTIEKLDRLSSNKKPEFESVNQGVAEGELEEGWKERLGGAALAGAMALGAGGAQARVTPDGQGGFTGGLKPTTTQQATNTAPTQSTSSFSIAKPQAQYDVDTQILTYKGKQYKWNSDAQATGQGEVVSAPSMAVGSRSMGPTKVELNPNGTYTRAPVNEATGRIPDPQNYDSDWDYYNDRDAEEPKDDDADYENMIDEPGDDWFDESKQKVGNMDADEFDDALARMKKLAGAGPMKTVWDPARRVYKNVPTAQQPAQQPKK